MGASGAATRTARVSMDRSPCRTKGSSEKSASALEDVLPGPRSSESSFGSTSSPGLEGVGEDRRGVRERRHAGPQLAEKRRVWLRDERAAGAGTRGSRAPREGGLSLMVSWRNGRAMLASAVKEMSRFTNSAAWVLRHRRGLPRRRSPSSLKKRPKRVSGSGTGCAATGSRSAQQRHERLDGGVQVLAPPRRARLRCRPASCAGPTRASSSNMLKNSSSSTDWGRTSARRRSSSPAAAPSASLAPRHELDVLEAE